MSDQLLNQFKADFRLLTKETISLELNAFEAFCLLGAAQLACRHPGFTGPSRQHAEAAARKVQEVISITPTLKLIAERGWNPDYDEPKGKT